MNGRNNRQFIVDRNDMRTLEHFITKSGSIIRQLTLKNFDSKEKVSDVFHHRMIKAAKLDSRETIFDFKSEYSTTPSLIFDNCHDGWFPFQQLKIEQRLEKVEIHISNPRFNCAFDDKRPPKSMILIDKFGSFIVRIDHKCNWRYWNFDVSNINVKKYDTFSRHDLIYTSLADVVSLKVKGFGTNLKLLNSFLVKRFRLDWIRSVGITSLEYTNGCLVFEETHPRGVFQFKGLSQLHFDKENFRRSAPFIINSLNMTCLDVSEKIELYEKFGNVALHILDSCTERRKVLILDGRQPFDYVENREDVKYRTGDILLFVKIRYFTGEDHLKKLDEWFITMGYHNVIEIGTPVKVPTVPEVTVSGSISTFMPFPYLNRAARDYGSKGNSSLTLPIFYFRNNSGLDCDRRRAVNTLTRAIGKNIVSSSLDCECGQMTSSDFFWNHCSTHYGTIEIKGSPELFKYEHIREIRDGQLWIHDTEIVTDLKSFEALKHIECESKHYGIDKIKFSAVRIDGKNKKLESVELLNLKKTKNCDRLVSISGDKNSLPKYSESQWMYLNKKFNSINILQENKKCIAYSRRNGGLSAEFAHQLEGCDTIEGDLTIDGFEDDVPRMTAALRKINAIRGNVLIKNLVTENCTVLKHVKYIGGNLNVENNPFLKRIFVSHLTVKGIFKISKSKLLCLETSQLRSSVEGFKKRKLELDCPYLYKNILSAFEDRFGDFLNTSYLGIALMFLIFVCYIMGPILWNQLRVLNIIRWREMTELDRRLKTDEDAYLDEEPDEMTWKTETLMMNGLDERVVEGEQMQKEKKRLGENGMLDDKLTRKMKALMRSRNEDGSYCEFTGQCWLRRKQQMETKKKDREEQTFKLKQTRWHKKETHSEAEELEDIEMETAFYAALSRSIGEISHNGRNDAINISIVLFSMMERKGLLKKQHIVSNYKKIKRGIALLETHAAKHDTKTWKPLAEIRAKLGTEATETFENETRINYDSSYMDSRKPKRMKAGAHKEKKQRKNKGMFAKIIVETLHWIPPDEIEHEKRKKKWPDYGHI